MGLFDKIKDFVGIEEEYYDEEFADEYEEEIQETPKEEKYIKEERTIKTEVKAPKPVTKSYGSHSDMVVTIKEALTYEDGKLVMDDVLAGKTVVLNLEMLEMEKKAEIFHFVSGGLYSLKGSIQKVTKDIYVLVPNGVEVDGKVKETLTSNSLYQL